MAQRLQVAAGVDVASSSRWYAGDPQIINDTYDVVLALANDGGVRSALQARQPTVLLHATTSRDWQAQLHRHVAGTDDCIDCRISPVAGAMACSEGQVEANGERNDAALPFLSLTAGVLLAAQLARLQHGAILELPNWATFDMHTPTPRPEAMTRICGHDCKVRLPRAARHQLDQHSRWRSLDAAA